MVFETTSSVLNLIKSSRLVKEATRSLLGRGGGDGGLVGRGERRLSPGIGLSRDRLGTRAMARGGIGGMAVGMEQGGGLWGFDYELFTITCLFP